MIHQPLADRRVYVVDDEAPLRSMIRRVLTGAGIYTEEFDSAEAFREGYSGRPIGCVLLDVRLPGMNGLDLLATIRQQPPANPVIILSGFADIEMAVTAVQAGAMEVLQKPFRSEKLFEAVDKGFRQISSLKLSGEVRRGLTPREREVLMASSDGAPTMTVSSRLNLSPRTVEMHRAAIVKKFDVRNMTEALLTAQKAGYIG